MIAKEGSLLITLYQYFSIFELNEVHVDWSESASIFTNIQLYQSELHLLLKMYKKECFS